jgi:hypothetical protein
MSDFVKRGQLYCVGDQSLSEESLEAKQAVVQNALIDEVEKFLNREITLVCTYLVKRWQARVVNCFYTIGTVKCIVKDAAHDMKSICHVEIYEFFVAVMWFECLGFR